jgi:hypothetical protein
MDGTGGPDMKKSIVFALIILVVIVAFFVVDILFFQKKDEPVVPEKAYMPAEVQQPPAPTEGITQDKVITRSIVEDVEKEKSFEDIQKELIDICRELDTRDYVKEYKLEGGTYKKFTTALEMLAYRPPVISGETKDLYTLLSNAAHFYRVAGKEDIRLVKDILNHEHDRIERLMSVVYEYLIMGSQEGKLMINIGQLYEYAGFFLNTLGGKAYLYRRDSTTRTLTQYYSVLILDKANKEKMNPYGIDIIPHLTILKEDLNAHKGLQGTNQYLAVLQNIEETTIR